MERCASGMRRTDATSAVSAWPARFERPSVTSPTAPGSPCRQARTRSRPTAHRRIDRTDGRHPPIAAFTSTYAPAMSLSRTRLATGGRGTTPPGSGIWAPAQKRYASSVRLPGRHRLAQRPDGSLDALAVAAYAGSGMSIESLRYLDARRTLGIWVVKGWDPDRTPSSMNSSTWVFKVDREDGFRFRHGQPVVSVGLSAKGEMLATASGWEPDPDGLRSHARGGGTPVRGTVRRSTLGRAIRARGGRAKSSPASPPRPRSPRTRARSRRMKLRTAPCGSGPCLRNGADPARRKSLGRPSNVFAVPGARDARILFSADSSRAGILGKAEAVLRPGIGERAIPGRPRADDGGFLTPG